MFLNWKLPLGILRGRKQCLEPFQWTQRSTRSSQRTRPSVRASAPALGACPDLSNSPAHLSLQFHTPFQASDYRSVPNQRPPGGKKSLFQIQVLNLSDFSKVCCVRSRKRSLVQKVEVTRCCSLTVAAATVAAAQFRLEKKGDFEFAFCICQSESPSLLSHLTRCEKKKKK